MEELKPERVARIALAAHRLEADDNIREALREMAESEGGGEPVSLDEARIGETRHKEHEHDPVSQDVKVLIDELSEEGQVELIALAWMGREDASVDEWDELLSLAEDRHSNHTADYLINMPLFGEYLEYALEEFGFELEDFEDEQG